MTAAAAAVKEIMKSMKAEAYCRKSALKIYQFLTIENRSFRELVADESLQVLIASLPTHTCAMKDGRISDLLFHRGRERNFSATLPNGARAL